MSDQLRIDIQNGVLIAHRDGREPVPLAEATIDGNWVRATEVESSTWGDQIVHSPAGRLPAAVTVNPGVGRMWIDVRSADQVEIAALLPHLIRFVETGTLEADA